VEKIGSELGNCVEGGVSEVSDGGVAEKDAEPLTSAKSVEGVGEKPIESLSSETFVRVGSEINLGNIDPRLGSFFSNLTNHGNVNVHFHFGDCK